MVDLPDPLGPMIGNLLAARNFEIQRLEHDAGPKRLVTVSKAIKGSVMSTTASSAVRRTLRPRGSCPRASRLISRNRNPQSVIDSRYRKLLALISADTNIISTNRDRGEQRVLLEHMDEPELPAAADDRPDRLWEMIDNESPGATGRARRRRPSSSWHGFETRAVDLRHVETIVERELEAVRWPAGHADADPGKAKKRGNMSCTRIGVQRMKSTMIVVVRASSGRLVLRNRGQRHADHQREKKEAKVTASVVSRRFGQSRKMLSANAKLTSADTRRVRRAPAPSWFRAGARRP